MNFQKIGGSDQPACLGICRTTDLKISSSLRSHHQKYFRSGVRPNICPFRIGLGPFLHAFDTLSGHSQRRNSSWTARWARSNRGFSKIAVTAARRRLDPTCSEQLVNLEICRSLLILSSKNILPEESEANSVR